MAYVSKNAKPKPKACKWCGKIFEPKTTRQQYCGDDYGECPVCGKPVKILDYQIGATACSEKCRQARIQTQSYLNLNKHITEPLWDSGRYEMAFSEGSR